MTIIFQKQPPDSKVVEGSNMNESHYIEKSYVFPCNNLKGIQLDY